MGSNRGMGGLLGGAREFVLVFAVSACSRETPSRRLLFDFESDEGWVVVSGDVSAVPSQRKANVARRGQAFLGTAEGGEKHEGARHGVLRSPVFRIDHDFLVFRAGGVGVVSQCSVELVDAKGKRVLREAENTGTPRMETHVLDVTKLRGKSARLQLVDREGEKPCSIHIDDVRLVDG